MHSWFFYVLRCADGSLYAKTTTDLPTQVALHKSGQGGEHTRHRLPVRLIHWQRYMSQTKAQQRLAEFNRWPRQKQENLVRGVHNEAKRRVRR